jgi:transitional endoplasmic reticulum ATPase
VRRKHFVDALNSTKPSVTDEAMRYYQNIGGELKQKGSRDLEKSMYV